MVDPQPTPAPAGARFDGLLFDVDGTLYAQGPLRLLMALEMFVAVCTSGRPFTTVNQLRRLAAFRRNRERLREAPPGAGLDAAQYRVPGRETSEDEAELRRLVADWMMRRPLKYLSLVRRTGLRALLDAVQGRGMRVGVFSDYPAHEKLHALGLGGQFRVQVCATDAAVDAFKPLPRGFEAACAQMGLEPSRVLYVGDRPEVDGEGAARAGMCAWIVGAGAGSRGGSFRRLRRELERP